MGAAGSSGTCCWDTETIDGGSNGFPLGRAQLMGAGPGRGWKKALCEGAPSLWAHGLDRGMAC